LKKKISLTGLIVLLLGILVACGDNPTTIPATATALNTTATFTVKPVSTTSAIATSSTAIPSLPTLTPLAIAATVGITPSQLPPTITPVAVSTEVSSATAKAIRQTKWLEVINSDPLLEGPTGTDRPESTPEKPFIRVKGADFVGTPELSGIVYVDMDGDGIEEAAIPLNSGGTAGNLGFLVYHQANPQPRLVAWEGGYKLFLLLEQGKLVVGNALYAGWEGNCCPSGTSYTTYTLKGDKLSVVAERNEGNAWTQPDAVSHFYGLLNGRLFEDAYKLLSDSYQKANPYKSWVAGYANTRKIEVEASEEPGVANTTRIKLTATDATSSGGEITRQFTGTWKATWDTTLKTWQLGDPSIKELTSTPQLHPAFQPILANLKSRTQVAILLPTVIPDIETSQIYATLSSANATSYQIEIGFSADCNGATVCRVGSVLAETVKPNSPPNKGSSVALANGTSGYFVDFACGASCSDSTLTWNQANVRYTVTMKAAKIETLVKMANSAISGGKL